MWDDLKSTLIGALDACVPSKMTKTRYNQPWILRELKRLTQRKKRAFKKAKMTRKAKDTKRYDNLKNITKKACKSAYSSYLNNIVDPDSQENPKQLWSFIKSRAYTTCFLISRYTRLWAQMRFQLGSLRN